MVHRLPAAQIELLARHWQHVFEQSEVGILLVDLMLPTEWKWTNALTALVGILFSTAGVAKIQLALKVVGLPGESAFLNSLVVDHFTIYFWYLFLASAAISILMSVRYLEIEHENHGACEDRRGELSRGDQKLPLERLHGTALSSSRRLGRVAQITDGSSNRHVSENTSGDIPRRARTSRRA